MSKSNAIAISTFNHSIFGSIRTINKDGEPWFIAKDVAVALGYKDVINAVKQHCRRVAKHHPYKQRVSSSQAINIIPESDFYRLVLRSKLPQAEAFQDWVTMEVLPSIRKTGTYMKQKKEPVIQEEPIGMFSLVMGNTPVSRELDNRMNTEKEKLVHFSANQSVSSDMVFVGIDMSMSNGEQVLRVARMLQNHASQVLLDNLENKLSNFRISAEVIKIKAKGRGA